MTRLSAAAAVAIALAIGAWSALPGLAAPDTVTVEGGAISGTTSNGVRVFKGIPYAAPPIGSGRWRPPQPVVAWSGVRDGAEVRG